MPEHTPAILPELIVFPERVLTGPGKVLSLGSEAARFGASGLIVHGHAVESRLPALLAAAPAGLVVTPFRHRGGEPTLDQVDELRRVARLANARWIAAVGGGSVLDLAKAAASLANVTPPTVAYHDGTPVAADGLPFLAVPTTAGTGSEATVNAVLTNTATGVKKSIRDLRMMARTVILDAELLSTCPPATIAASGMDAFTQAVEAYTSRGATAFSDGLALQGLRLIGASLEEVHRDARDPAAGDLLAGSFLTGVALSVARLGVVHGLAHPLGSLYHQPHGLVCAACLPHAIRFNRPVLGGRYEALSQAVGMDLLQRVLELNDRLGIGAPFAGQPVRARAALIAETLASGSTKSNPRPVTAGDVEWFLDSLFSAKPSR
jgi:alcohol dehydrogenase class IV